MTMTKTSISGWRASQWLAASILACQLSVTSANERACSIDRYETRIAAVDELARLSEHCWAQGEIQTSIAMLVIAELRLVTDRSLRSGDGSSAALVDTHHLEGLLKNLHLRMTGNVEENWLIFIAAVDAVDQFYPEPPPDYPPAYTIDTNALDYEREFDFQRARMKPAFYNGAELALNPDWTAILARMDALRETINPLDTGPEALELFDLQRRADEISEAAARQVADQIGVDYIRTLVRSRGRFQPVGDVKVTEREESPYGIHLYFDDFRHLETTQVIPMRYGESFGLQVEVAGVPIRVPLEFEWRIQHGPKEQSDGSFATETRSPFHRRSYDGRISGEIFFTAVEGVPVVCGPWRFDLLYGDEILLSESFELVGCD